MAATGFTPISLYYSSTAAAVPSAGNLTDGELALNTADMKLYAKNSSGAVTLLASSAATSGVSTFSAGTTGFTPSTATSGAVTLAGTLATANGGTGLSSYTANGVLYASGTTTLTNGSGLVFDGTNLGVGLSSPSYQLQVQGLGQDTANLTDAGNKGGSIYVRANGVTSGSGGAVLFGTTFGNATPFAAIKGFVTDGGLNTKGDLAFSMRGAIGDTALTERIRIDSAGNVVLKTGALQEVKTSLPANNIDLSTGNFFTKTISGATTLTVSNVPASGTTASFIFDVTNGGSATITWWSGTKWAGGTAPTLTAAGRDSLGFYTYDGGTTWTGLVLGKDIK